MFSHQPPFLIDHGFHPRKTYLQPIRNRGPDAQKGIRVLHENVVLDFYVSVLHLRGPETVIQPLQCPNSGDVLCWNGEVFHSDFWSAESRANDTEAIATYLWSENNRSNEADFETRLCSMLQSIQGPFAMIYYHQASSRVYFCRDAMGRRSLLQCKSWNAFALSSVAIQAGTDCFDEWREVKVDGLYYLDLTDSILEPQWMAWGERLKSHFQFNVKPCLSNDPLRFTLLTPLKPQHLMTSKDKLRILDANPPSSSFRKHLDRFQSILGEAVRQRIQALPPQVNFFSEPTSKANIAILFSGGLDCTLLAWFVHLHLPADEPIDLLNVAFENPRAIKHSKSLQLDPYVVPDRQTGLQSFAELQLLAPSRVWNFVEINVPFAQYLNSQSVIRERMYPHSTVMDLSIASAFWFAARGKGCVGGVAYQSTAKVLFSGLGADELFGGYSHHRAAYFSATSNDERWSKLRKALHDDLQSLPYRNCGRDDRLFSDHGKEIRLPFLDENVVQFASTELVLDYKCIFVTQSDGQNEEETAVPKGVGEKLFLRYVAQSCGFQHVCVEAKRAIQFGARTAKMTDSDEKGDRVLR